MILLVSSEKLVCYTLEAIAPGLIWKFYYPEVIRKSSPTIWMAGMTAIRDHMEPISGLVSALLENCLLITTTLPHGGTIVSNMTQLKS